MTKGFVPLKILLLFVLLAFTSWAALAQGDCPALVEKALKAIGDNCGALDRNSACYGFDRVDATFAQAVAENTFSAPSDRTGISTLQTVDTTPLDTGSNRWGIAVLNVQANVPNTLPGQGVVFMLLGDVKVDNAVPADKAVTTSTSLDVTTITQANLRSSASASANVVKSVPAGTKFQADGISADGKWLRILDSGIPAWISPQVVQVSGDLSTLPVISKQNRSPMQAFYFSTGAGKPNCSEAPPSALVLQGPKKVRVDLNVNGADISIGSTVVMTAANNQFDLWVIDGAAYLNGNIIVPGGFHISAPLSSDGHSLGGRWTGLRPMTQDELDEFKPLGNIPSNLLHYPIVFPTMADIFALQTAIQQHSGGNNSGGGGITGGMILGPAAKKVQCSKLRPTSPIGRLPWDTVTFYWDPAPGATSYHLYLYTDQNALAFNNEVIAPQTSMPLDARGLPGGPNYTWEVQALVNGELACTTPRASVTRDNPPQGTNNPGVASMSASWSCSGTATVRVSWSNAPSGSTIIISFTNYTGGPNGGTFSGSSGSATFSPAASVSNGVVRAQPSGMTVNLPGAFRC